MIASITIMPKARSTNRRFSSGCSFASNPVSAFCNLPRNVYLGSVGCTSSNGSEQALFLVPHQPELSRLVHLPSPDQVSLHWLDPVTPTGSLPFSCMNGRYPANTRPPMWAGKGVFWASGDDIVL